MRARNRPLTPIIAAPSRDAARADNPSADVRQRVKCSTNYWAVGFYPSTVEEEQNRRMCGFCLASCLLGQRPDDGIGDNATWMLMGNLLRTVECSLPKMDKKGNSLSQRSFGPRAEPDFQRGYPYVRIHEHYPKLEWPGLSGGDGGIPKSLAP
jgi:hypothetical protein